MQHVEGNQSPTQPTRHSPSALTSTTPVQKQTSPPHQSTSAPGITRKNHTNIELSNNLSILIPKSSIRLLIPESTCPCPSSSDFISILTGSSPVKISAIGTSDVNTIFASSTLSV